MLRSNSWLSLKPWGAVEAQSLQKMCRAFWRWSALNSSGNYGPKFGWHQSLPGNLKKNGFTFPMLFRSSFNILCLAVCCGGKTAWQEEPLCSELQLQCHQVSVVQWSAPFCLWLSAHQLVCHELHLRRPTAYVRVWTCLLHTRNVDWWLPS